MAFFKNTKQNRRRKNRKSQAGRRGKRYNILGKFFGTAPRKRGRRSSDNLKKHILILAAIFLLAIPVVLSAFWLSTKSNEQACAAGSLPDSRIIVLIDGSQKNFTKTQKRMFEKHVVIFDNPSKTEMENTFLTQVPAGTQLSIYKIEKGNVGAPKAIFDKCRLPTTKDMSWYDHIYAGGLITDIKFSNEFLKEMKEALYAAINGGNSSESPIMEIIKNVTSSNYDEKTKVELIIFSDLEQFTQKFSVYQWRRKCPKITIFHPTPAPVCAPEPQKPECSIALKCDQTLPECPKPICLKKDTCEPEPTCGNPTKFCFKPFGANPFPDCDCSYQVEIEGYKKRCDEALRSCRNGEAQTLAQCLSERDEKLETCRTNFEVTKDRCREEQREYNKIIVEHQEECRSDYEEWVEAEKARKKLGLSHQNSSCFGSNESPFGSYSKNYKLHWKHVRPKIGTINKIKFIHLRGNNPTDSWDEKIEKFWRGYADFLKIEVEFIRE